MSHSHHTHLTDDTGQTMAEYSVLIGFLVLTVVVVFPSLGSAVGSLYSGVTQAFGG